MAEELRKTGISVVGDVPWGTHFCYFYETKQDLLHILVPYFKVGLESNEFCLWIISNSELITTEEAKAALGDALDDLDRYLTEGRIEIVRHDQWFLQGGSFNFHKVANRFKEKLDEALARGYAGMRVNGSPAWIQTRDANELREFEKEVDHLFPNQHIIASCTYPLEENRAAFLLDVASNHQFVIAMRQGNWQILETPQLIQAKQEIQRLNEELEQRVDERTKDLAAANEQLRKEIAERQQAEEALAERLRFETLITELSATFANLPPNEVDREIDKWLQTLVEFLGVDRASFFQFGADWTTLYRSHSYTVRGIEPLPPAPMGMKDQFPWITDQLRRGVTVKWSRIPDDMPEEATKEKEYAARLGIKSGLNIPVRMGGSVICAITFASLVNYRDWPDAMVARLRLVGEIFAAAIERKRAEEKLVQSQRQLAEAQRLAHIGSWDWDLRTNAVTWSDELYHIFGLQPGTISVAEEVDRFIHPDDLDSGWDTVKRAVARKEPYDYYHRILRPDGTERIARSRGSIMSDERGEPIRVFGATQDVTELKCAEEKLKETSEQLRALSASLQSAREEEGTRIAREIHDELGGALTSWRWDLEEIRDVISEPFDSSQATALRTKIEGMIKLTETTLDTVRKLASALRPMALELGLMEGIEWQVLQFENRTGIRVRLESTLERVDLDNGQATAVFRILQEALTNIQRHAQATHVAITCWEESGQFILTIKDNGRGITDSERSARQSLGLLGMSERVHLVGGEISVEGVEGKGTKVTVQVPLSDAGRWRGRSQSDT